MRRKHSLPSIAELKRLLELMPDGSLVWRPRLVSDFKREQDWKSWTARHVGQVAGTQAKSGYVSINIDHIPRYAHRIVWALTTGSWPAGETDHINGVRDDNRPENLRAVTTSINQRNRRQSRNNTSGVCGVSWSHDRNKWCAYINSDSGREPLGYFTNIDEAAAVRKAAEIRLGYTERHGRVA